MKALTHTSTLFAMGLVLGLTTIQAADPAPSGMHGLFLRQLADVEKKMNSLAVAMPADKYSWRPAAEVRSNSEGYVHIAGANYMFPNIAGVKPPAGITRDMEKTVTEKDKVLDVMKQSFEHARQAVMGLSDADMEKPVKMFGR